METPALFTLPQLARRFNVTERQAEYAVKCYRIEPTMRVSHVRLFDERAAREVQSAIRRIQSNNW